MVSLLPVLRLLPAVCAQPPPPPAPSVPTGLVCTPTGAAVGLAWHADVHADTYEVEVGLSAAAAVDTPVASTTAAGANATFGGLKSGATYYFKVRAHGGATGIQRDVEWSDFSSPIPCAVPALAEDSAKTAATAPSTASTSLYTLMYRVSEVWGNKLWGRTYAPPDFLSSHNSADGPGQSSFLTFAELSLMTASESINTSTITEYCVEGAGPTSSWGKYLSCPAGGNMSAWGPQEPLCYCAHDIDRYIQHRDFCGGDTWKGGHDSCGSTCGEMWQNAIEFTQQSGVKCVGCGGKSCTDMMNAGQPLCSGCTSVAQCNKLWSWVWSTKPQLSADNGHDAPTTAAHRTKTREQNCNCAAGEVDFSLANPGIANITWPPGLGQWFSTPAGGKCPEGQPLGSPAVGGGGGPAVTHCTWRREPHARMVYGYQLVEAGFVREDGPDVHGQTLVSLDRHVKNAATFKRVFAEHPVAPAAACAHLGS